MSQMTIPINSSKILYQKIFIICRKHFFFFFRIRSSARVTGLGRIFLIPAGIALTSNTDVTQVQNRKQKWSRNFHEILILISQNIFQQFHSSSLHLTKILIIQFDNEHKVVRCTKINSAEKHVIQRRKHSRNSLQQLLKKNNL